MKARGWVVNLLICFYFRFDFQITFSKNTTQLFLSITNNINEYEERRKKKMSRLRILLAAILCVSLLTFVGCGEDGNTEGNAENGTITEESTDMNTDKNNDVNSNSTENGKNNDGSVMEDLEEGADDAVDDLERDARDASDSIRDGAKGSSRSNDAKESNVGQ